MSSASLIAHEQFQRSVAMRIEEPEMVAFCRETLTSIAAKWDRSIGTLSMMFTIGSESTELNLEVLTIPIDSLYSSCLPISYNRLENEI